MNLNHVNPKIKKKTELEFLGFKDDRIISKYIIIKSYYTYFRNSCQIIRISSDGCILYKHTRVGYRDRFFTMLKFRSMRTSLTLKDTKLINDMQVNGVLCKLNDDPRLTKFGKFIRKTSIDELPQLFNVFVGNMSLVGPRPLVPLMVEPYPNISRARTMVKPGITGMWQVFSRNKNTSVFDMIDWDLKYLEQCSIFFDLYLLLNTIPTIISRKGAI